LIGKPETSDFFLGIRTDPPPGGLFGIEEAEAVARWGMARFVMLV
jgi:hypothetical protein